MRKLLLDKISIPILILGVFVVVAIGWWLYEGTIGSFTTTIFYGRFDHDAIRHMDVSYQSGYAIDGWDGNNGMVIGTITDKATRDRLLSIQPFTDCPHGCSGWYHYGDNLPHHESVFRDTAILGNHTIPPKKFRDQARAAISSDNRCVARYSSSHRTNDVFCFSPSSGAFVYEFAEMSGM